MKKLAFLLIPAVLAGCATHYENEVTLYSESEIPRQRGSIAIAYESDHEPGREERKAFTKKFKALDEHIKQGLVRTGFEVVDSSEDPGLTLTVSCRNEHISHGPEFLADMGKVTRNITIGPYMLVGGYISEKRAMTCDMSLNREDGDQFAKTYAESFETFNHASPLGLFALPFHGVAGADGACKMPCQGADKHEKVMAAKLVSSLIYDSATSGFFEKDGENHIPEVFDLSGAGGADGGT